MAKRRCKPSLTRCPLRGRNCCRPRNAGHNSSSDTRHGEEQTVRSSSNFYSVGEIETRIAAHDASTSEPSLSPVHVAALAADLKAVWSAPPTDARLKKRI